MDADQSFELTRFFPYRLAVLADAVSQAVARLYTDRFHLNRAEWRILAALGNNAAMTARDLAPYSTLDKMQVSRAVARLVENGLVAREENPRDRRVKLLQLTPSGNELYRRIVPLATAREVEILSALDGAERAILDKIMQKLHCHARGLIDRPAGQDETAVR